MKRLSLSTSSAHLTASVSVKAAACFSEASQVEEERDDKGLILARVSHRLIGISFRVRGAREKKETSEKTKL